MSATSLDAARTAAQSSILKKFTAAYESTEKDAKGYDPSLSKRAAARIALEYAVIKTAMERGTATQVVASVLSEGVEPERQAQLIRDGRVAMERAYGHSPDLIAGALAGKVVDVPMPKGFVNNPEMDKLIDLARNSVASITQEEYAGRGRFIDVGPRADLVETAAHVLTSPKRIELASRLAFIESAIDSAVARGHFGQDPAKAQEAAAMFKARIEGQVFQPRPPESLKYTEKVLDFYKSHGQQMRSEVMSEVRAVTQARTINEIGAKLDQTMKILEQTRPDKDIER